MPAKQEESYNRAINGKPYPSRKTPHWRETQIARFTLRPCHYSRRTKKAYAHSVKRFIFFYNVHHPSEMYESVIYALLVYDGKGTKDRITMLPVSLKAPLQEHLNKVKLSINATLPKGEVVCKEIDSAHL